MRQGPSGVSSPLPPPAAPAQVMLVLQWECHSRHWTRACVQMWQVRFLRLMGLSGVGQNVTRKWEEGRGRPYMDEDSSGGRRWT